MIRFENDCVGCPGDLGCLGNACRYINVKHLYCDKCEYEFDELFKVDGDELCFDCMLDELDIERIK